MSAGAARRAAIRSLGLIAVKPPPDRLYGRARGHKLRPRQEKLLEVTLPRLLVDPEDPWGSFAVRPSALWLEVGFGGGEHALAQIAAFPGIGLIACEVFENGICSLLSRLVPEGGEADAPLPGNLRLWTDDARLLLARCRMRAWTGCSCCSPTRGRRRGMPSAASCIRRCCRCWRAC